MKDWQLRYFELKEQIDFTSEAIDKVVVENNFLKSENFVLSSIVN